MQSNRKLLLAGAALVLIIVIGAFFAVSRSAAKPAATPTPTPAYEETAYTGTETLLARGYSADQVRSLKFAFYRYFRDSNRKVTQVAITNVAHVHDRDAEPTDYLTFDVLVDQKSTFQAKAEYSDLDSTRLLLTDPSSKAQLFDSGVVKVTSGD